MLLRLWYLSKVARTSIELLTACLLGGATLWWVAVSAGPTTGTAIVHVREIDVDVQVGGVTYHIVEETLTPIVCQLPAGEHRLVMTSGSTELHSETFSIRGGEDVILTAWRSRERAASLTLETHLADE
jgi:hypothetical protein